MKKKNDTGLVANIPTVIFFFRYGLISLYTVVFGRFPRPKKCNFWIVDTLLKSDNFLKHSLSIICHFGHCSFFMIFLNVAWYTILALSRTTILTPIDVHLVIVILFLFKKKILRLTCFAFFWSFSEAKV